MVARRLSATLLFAAAMGVGCDGSTTPVRAAPAAPHSLRAPPPATPGGSTITGSVVSFEDGSVVEDALCVALVDPEPRAFGGTADTIATTTTSAGTFSFADLPLPHTVGWVVVVDACGDTDTWIPTGTILPGEAVSGRGPSDTIAVEAWLVRRTTRDDIDAGLEASGSASVIGEDGGMMGHSLAEDGSPHHESWVRGPNATQLWYARASGAWALYENTDQAAGALWVAPDAEDIYGVWVTRVGGGQFEPLMAGGLPGVLLVWDFVSWTPRSLEAL